MPDAKSAIIYYAQEGLPATPPDWQSIFKNKNPLKIEIGSGKGKFLLQRLEEEPDVNFVAMEIRRKRVEKIDEKAIKQELKNVRIIHGNAKDILVSFFPITSVDTFFIHFPDPWPKRRHIRRRLMDSNFINNLHDLLRPQGKIYFTTDVTVYAKSVSESFEKHPGFETLYQESGDHDFPYHQSIHEWKFKNWGRTIFYFCFGKTTS